MNDPYSLPIAPLHEEVEGCLAVDLHIHVCLSVSALTRLQSNVDNNQDEIIAANAVNDYYTCGPGTGPSHVRYERVCCLGVVATARNTRCRL
jgi:hypothetical protein